MYYTAPCIIRMLLFATVRVLVHYIARSGQKSRQLCASDHLDVVA